MSNFSEVSSLLTLIQQSKYFEAESLYKSFVNDSFVNYSDVSEDAISKMLYRADQVKQTLDAINKETSNDWTLGMTYLGIETHYKIEKDNLVSVRIEGILDNIPFLEQAAVLNEVDLFKTWIPFCTNSVAIDRITDVEVIAYLSSYIPPLSRDALVHVYAADCLESHDKFVLIGNSIDEWPLADQSQSMISSSSSKYNPVSINISKLNGKQCDIDEVNSVTISSMNEEWPDSVPNTNKNESDTSSNINPKLQQSVVPWIPKGWFHDRMIIKDFRAVFTILAPNTLKTSFIICIDPRASLPKTLLNFIMRNVAGLFLYCFKQQAYKVGRTPDCPYLRNFRARPSFYIKWLVPRLKEYYLKRGWELEPNFTDSLEVL